MFSRPLLTVREHYNKNKKKKFLISSLMPVQKNSGAATNSFNKLCTVMGESF